MAISATNPTSPTTRSASRAVVCGCVAAFTIGNQAATATTPVAHTRRIRPRGNQNITSLRNGSRRGTATPAQRRSVLAVARPDDEYERGDQGNADGQCDQTDVFDEDRSDDRRNKEHPPAPICGSHIYRLPPVTQPKRPAGDSVRPALLCSDRKRPLRSGPTREFRQDSQIDVKAYPLDAPHSQRSHRPRPPGKE
jgi:hypothetical protein